MSNVIINMKNPDSKTYGSGSKRGKLGKTEIGNARKSGSKSGSRKKSTVSKTDKKIGNGKKVSPSNSISGIANDANKLVNTNNAKAARSIYSATPTADRSAVAASNPALADSSTYSGGYSTDEYETTQNPSFDRLRQQYQNDMNSLYNTRVNYLAGVRDRAIGDARTKYAGLANNAYIAYRQNMAKRRSMASNLGMTGGAVENLRVGDENNYNNSLANVNSGRNTAYTNARNAYSDAENDARVSRDTSIANNQAELSQAEIAYNQSQKQFDAQLAAQQAQWETENMQRANELKQAQDEANANRKAAYETAKALNKLQKQVNKLQNRNNRGKGK